MILHLFPTVSTAETSGRQMGDGVLTTNWRLGQVQNHAAKASTVNWRQWETKKAPTGDWRQWETSGRQMGDNYKIIHAAKAPTAQETGDKWETNAGRDKCKIHAETGDSGRQMGDKCKIMRPQQPELSYTRTHVNAHATPSARQGFSI